MSNESKGKGGAADVSEEKAKGAAKTPDEAAAQMGIPSKRKPPTLAVGRMLHVYDTRPNIGWSGHRSGQITGIDKLTGAPNFTVAMDAPTDTHLSLHQTRANVPVVDEAPDPAVNPDGCVFAMWPPIT